VTFLTPKIGWDTTASKFCSAHVGVWNCVGLEELEGLLVSAECGWRGETNVKSVFLWLVRLEYVDACEDDFVLETVLVLEDVVEL
jgi:hypothetical protein